MAGRTSQPGKKKPEPRIGIYAGSFDPVTYGHLDVIRRASKILDHLIVAIGINQAKPPMFTVAERMEMIRDLCKDLPNEDGLGTGCVICRTAWRDCPGAGTQD